MKPRFSIVYHQGTVKIFDEETLIGFFPAKDVLFATFVDNKTYVYFKGNVKPISIPAENVVEQIMGYVA